MTLVDWFKEKELSDDLTVLKEIEQLIGEKLTPCPADKDILHWELRNTYLLNANQQIIGLNLSHNNLSDITVLKACPNLTTLDLWGNNLSDITVLQACPNLTTLDLSVNQLSDLTVLQACPNLTTLVLSDNNLSDITVLQACPNLTTLDLGNNQLNDITVLKALTRLTTLDLSVNKLSDITVLQACPNLTTLHLSLNNLSDLTVLKACPNLTTLALSANNLSDITVLQACPNLTTLHLGGNNLSDLTVLQACPNLTTLDLRHNNLSDITVLKACPNLTTLNLWGNKLSDITVLKACPNLTELDLRANQLKTVPEWLLDLNIPIMWERDYQKYTGVGVYLEGNPLEQPPPEIIKQGNAAIRAYFEQLKKEGSDTIYEAKLILVGEGGAGKTSLANKIKKPDWQLIPETQSESTKGIDILKYEFIYKDKTFRVNIWDFGGQEIYHSTHQFFLSKRALYFLLADNRNENTDFYHWLNIVDLLSTTSPLLIIKNEKSNRSRSIPEQQLKAEFGNIKDILATNLNDNRGLEKIIASLQHFITQLPHIGSPLPKTWVKVRQQLEELAKTKNCIELKEYFAICQANGFEKEADKLQLSEYLHDLGVCLHFQHDENSPLYKILILKPTWATDAVYKVLDNPQVINNAGHFSKQDLATIWQDEQYADMRGELLALMQKFTLCYEIPNQAQHYIAPQLLNENPPPMTGSPLRTASHTDNLLLRYQYDFMPKGIISQFIVIMHEYIASNYQWVWKNGVVLEKDKTQAEIIEYYGKREIHIRVYGQNKKELLTIIRHELDKINKNYERLKDKCRKLIPCNCEKCLNLEEPHFYSDNVLKQFRLDRQLEIQCQKSYKMVQVLKLIDDIDLTGFKNLSGLDEAKKEKGDTYNVYGNLIKEVSEMGDNYHLNNVDNKGGIIGKENKIETADSKEESLFKKPLFYIGAGAFIYFMLVAWEAYDLQQKGLLGNKTFKEIVLSPIPLLKTDDKK